MQTQKSPYPLRSATPLLRGRHRPQHSHLPSPTHPNPDLTRRNTTPHRRPHKAKQRYARGCKNEEMDHGEGHKKEENAAAAVREGSGSGGEGEMQVERRRRRAGRNGRGQGKGQSLKREGPRLSRRRDAVRRSTGSQRTTGAPRRAPGLAGRWCWAFLRFQGTGHEPRGRRAAGSGQGGWQGGPPRGDGDGRTVVGAPRWGALASPRSWPDRSCLICLWHWHRGTAAPHRFLPFV